MDVCKAGALSERKERYQSGFARSGNPFLYGLRGGISAGVPSDIPLSCRLSYRYGHSYADCPGFLHKHLPVNHFRDGTCFRDSCAGLAALPIRNHQQGASAPLPPSRHCGAADSCGGHHSDRRPVHPRGRLLPNLSSLRNLHRNSQTRPEGRLRYRMLY